MRPRRPSLTKISNLLQGALGRHGITKQVTAAMVVQRAEEVLAEMLEGTPLADDVRVTSYHNNEMLLGCANAPASFDMEAMVPEFLKRMAVECPEATISKVIARVHIERSNY
ncbi:MAG: hypothetical protein AAB839_00385 [Patescibacteria group bacterium]